METNDIYNNTLDNERIMFLNGEYLNLRNNTQKMYYTNVFVDLIT
jgi:hypothetical protein